MKVYKINYSIVYDTYFISVCKIGEVEYGYMVYIVNKKDYEVKPFFIESEELENKEHYSLVFEDDIKELLAKRVLELIDVKNNNN